MFFAGKGFRTNAFQTRRILIVSSIVAAVITAAAWTFSSLGGAATPTRSVADAARAATPVPTPSAAPETARPSWSATPGTGSAASPRPGAAGAAGAAGAGSTAAKRAKRPAAKREQARPRVISAGTCEASFYSEPQDTASGEQFDPSAMTAAHKTLPLGSKVRVTNKANGDTVTVRINDRGPYIAGRCLDLSRAAMAAVGGIGSGVIPVRYEVLARA